MERFLVWIRENPQFAALGFSFAVLTLVMSVLAFMMTRAGVSLRPLIWFGGFVAIIAGPQAVVHFLDGVALRHSTLKPEAATTRDSGVPGSALAPIPWATVFGPNADPSLITDAKRGLAAIVGDAAEAKLSFNTAGESALAARFATPQEAARALDVYRNFFALANPRGSATAGLTARRHAGQGEWVHVVAAGPELYAWTGANVESVLANRTRALGAPDATGEMDTPREKRLSSPDLVSNRLRANTKLMLGIVALNLVAAVGWFFKGSAWAARVDASHTALPTPERTLRDNLLALNKRDLPTGIAARADGTLEINWRYADARWFDLMRLHEMKRTQRLVLIFDEPGRTVRVREYWSAFDASAGLGNLRLNWKMNTGIQFFAIEHKRVLGVQLGTDGKPTGELSKAYTFDLQALKAPVIDAVTQAGWRWQPVTWNAPAPLRWLTE